MRPPGLYIPNTITLTNLAVGCLAVMSAWNGRFENAAYLILICIVLDFSDGFMARLLKAYSDLGKQLDSLADLVSFGVAPSAIAAGLIQQAAAAQNWPVSLHLTALLIPVFSAIRLARFNLLKDSESHFCGMPVPADAVAFAALALIYTENGFQGIGAVLLSPVFIIALIVTNSVLMVSRVSMFSFKLKSYRLADNLWRYLFVFMALLVIVLLRSTGLFFVFVFYVLASLGMNLKLRLQNAGQC